MFGTPSADNNPRDLSLLNLIYLAFLVLPLFFASTVTNTQLLITAISVMVFLPLYFLTFRVARNMAALIAAAQVGLCLAVLPFNPGGNTYLIYAVITFAHNATARYSIAFLLASLAIMLIEMIYLSYPMAFFISTAILASMLVAYTLYGQKMAQHRRHLALSQQEVQRLAQRAERERIARDLHDMLGHTMSLIVMKSELAGRLFARDANAALVQIQEVETIARASLDQIRHAVSGIRLATLEAELASARLNLLAADVQLHYQLAPINLPSDMETTLALVVREAITNIIRHAKASHVEIELREQNNTLQLQISDDGKGSALVTDINVAGNGINGMRERVQLLGGTLTIDNSPNGGVRLTINCPLPANVATA